MQLIRAQVWQEVIPKHGRGVTSVRRRQASQGRDLCQVVIRAVFPGGRTLATP